MIPTARRGAASAKSEQRIRDILRVGREVFSERGYESATTVEIAQRLGISEATVFTYFRGKRELCISVIGEWYDEIIAAMERALPRDQPVRRQLEVFVLTHLQLFLVQGTGLCALVLSEGRSKGPGLGEVLVPLQRRYTAPLMDMLARGQASGAIRNDVPLRLLRSMVLGPMEHILWEAVGQRQVPEPAGLAATSAVLADLLWSSVRAPEVAEVKLAALQSDLAQLLARQA
ncbi:TetR/AcrR family transcriptional regulator [Ideonella sp.]|uniref:TetR/AcrR family transcriptional regulator n=1 Tax=Ideonella sp. TaxID=1929293 RepID=UPI003BB58616